VNLFHSRSTKIARWIFPRRVVWKASVTRFVARAAQILAAQILDVIASGKPDWVAGGFACNGYGNLSPGKYNLT
jgi:aquaporin Z